MSISPIVKQSAVSGNSTVQTYQKDGLMVPSAGIEEIFLLSAKDIFTEGFVYKVPEQCLNFLLLSLEMNKQSGSGTYTLSKNGSVVVSGSGSSTPLISLPVTVLLPTDTLSFTHTYNIPINLTIYAKTVYLIENIKLN